VAGRTIPADPMLTNRTSRLAPSPTGALHLGNARTFLINWAIARQQGWRLLMRVEDLDGPRVRPGSIEQTLELLSWLGLDWDGEVMIQSTDLDPYRAAMRRLADAGRVYACSLTRRQIEQAASAPHKDDHELRFPPELRPEDSGGWCFDEEKTNYRLLTCDESIRIDDAVLGPRDHRPFAEIGDFIIWTKRGLPAYQLAVVVDDARQGVTDVLRGADLLPSAARQTLLYRALGLEAPRWWHVALVLGPDGRRLAKRHGDTRLDTYRLAGVPASRIVGLLAAWSGVADTRGPMDAAEFRERFDLARLSREPIVMTEEDHAWLLAST
jgi:glutamyl-tRNA synthetase